MSYKIQEAFEEVIKHWHKTMPALLYSMLIGLLIIGLIWVDTQLIKTGVFLNKTSVGSISEILFFTSGVFLIVPNVVLLGYRCYIAVKVIVLRKRYSIEKNPKRYSLIDFNGKVYIVDRIRKKMRWIQTWQTAVDLNLTDSWTRSGISLDEPGIFSDKGKSMKTIYGEEIIINEYQKGSPIYTQDSPN
jgi:hypothetical protein